MYILIKSNDHNEIDNIKKLLNNIYEDETYLIPNTNIEAREIIDEKQISLAFIEISDLSDIELAKKIKIKNPVVNIIFIAGTKDYAYDAFLIHASGYILKPIDENKVLNELHHLRFQLNVVNKNRVEVHCFGKFDVFVDGQSLKFSRSKTKELFAYLVDRNGTMCNSDDLLSILWPDDEPTYSLKQQLRNLIFDLNKSLRKLELEDIIVRHHNEIGLDKEKIKCDYYDFQKGDPKALQAFRGEYMSQYSDWSYLMECNLQKYFYDE